MTRPAATARPWGEVIEDIGRSRSELAQLERDLRGARWYQRRRKRALRDQIAANRAAADALVDELAGGRRDVLTGLAEMSSRRKARTDALVEREYEKLQNSVRAQVDEWEPEWSPTAAEAAS